MHPLKDQREGVKYGRGVKYGVTPVSKGGGQLTSRKMRLRKHRSFDFVSDLIKNDSFMSDFLRGTNQKA